MYTKPDVTLLGNARMLIERNDLLQKVGDPPETISDPDTSHNVPAYDLDE